jgi:hypothetical protein
MAITSRERRLGMVTSLRGGSKGAVDDPPEYEAVVLPFGRVVRGAPAGLDSLGYGEGAEGRAIYVDRIL